MWLVAQRRRHVVKEGGKEMTVTEPCLAVSAVWLLSSADSTPLLCWKGVQAAGQGSSREEQSQKSVDKPHAHPSRGTGRREASGEGVMGGGQQQGPLTSLKKKKNKK